LDDLTGWTSSNMTDTWDGTNELTQLTATATGGTHQATSTFGGDIPRRSIVCLLYRMSSYDASATWSVKYSSTPSVGLGSEYKSLDITVDSGTDTEWKMLVFEVGDFVRAHPNHHIAIKADYTGAGSGTYEFKRVIWLPKTPIPFLSVDQHWSWTEHASSADHTIEYSLIYCDENGAEVVGPTVPEGNSAMSLTILSTEWFAPITTKQDFNLRAIGFGGLKTDVTTGTQEITSDVVAAKSSSLDNVYEEIAPISIWDRGSSVPDERNLNDGLYLKYSFDATSDEEIFAVFDLPHWYKAGSDIIPVVRWTTTTKHVSTDVRWGLEYEWEDEGDAFSSSTTIYQTSASGDAGEHMRTAFSAITGTGYEMGSAVVVRLFRDADNGADTYGYDAGFLSLKFLLEKDAMGSTSAWTK
jgi:hypothetical protein